MNIFQLIISIILAVPLIIWLFFKYKFTFWKKRGVLHDQPVFPFGSISGLGSVIHMSHFLQNIYEKYKGKDKIAGFYILFQPSVIILDVDLYKNILIKDFNYFDERGMYYNEVDDPISAHLFALNGEKWRPLRTKLSPAFTSGKMKFMFSTIVDVGDRLRTTVQQITEENGQIIEIKDILARYTTDVIGTCAFGIECDSLNDPNAEFRNMGRDVFAKTRHSGIVQNFLSVIPSIAHFFRIKVFREYLSEFFLRTAIDNIKYREEHNIRRNDFIDLLIKLREETNTSLTYNEMAAQAFVFFLAGFETSSTALSYCLYELSQLPDVQEKIRQEIHTVMKKYDNKLTYEATMEMVLVEAAINESLRKYPPISSLSRRTKHDYKVPETNHVIEKGTMIWLPIFAVQNDPEYFPEPEKFEIERFTPEEIANRGSNKFLPFGEGPRNCIGLRFGMMQAKIGLATLLDNFEFTLSKETSVPLKLQPRPFILASEGGIYLNVKCVK